MASYCETSDAMGMWHLKESLRFHRVSVFVITITNSIASTITEVDGSALVTPRLQVDGVVRQSAIQNVTNWRMVSSGILIDPKTDSRHCYFASPAHSSSLRPVMPVVRRM
jgi:hypothetical protein